MEQLKLFPDEAPQKDSWEPKAPISQTKSTFKKKKKRFRSKEEYYKSEEWESVRIFAIHRAGKRCQKCGASGILQVHHLTYDNLYNEKPQDLEVLCKKCHKKADREREEESCYDSAFETYMVKKYGEDFEHFDGCEEEFEAWVERKQGLEW